jgi:hypothetical protein
MVFERAEIGTLASLLDLRQIADKVIIAIEFCPSGMDKQCVYF